MRFAFNDYVKISENSPIAPGLHGVIVNSECWFPDENPIMTKWTIELCEPPFTSNLIIEDQFVELIEAATSEQNGNSNKAA